MKTLEDAYVEGFCKAAEDYGANPEELTKVALSLKDLKRAADLLDKAYAHVDRPLRLGGPGKLTPMKDILLGSGVGGAISGGLGSLGSKLFGNDSSTNTRFGAGVGAGLGAGVGVKALRHLKKVRNPKLKALASTLAVLTGLGAGGLTGAVGGKIVG